MTTTAEIAGVFLSLAGNVAVFCFGGASGALSEYNRWRKAMTSVRAERLPFAGLVTARMIDLVLDQTWLGRRINRKYGPSASHEPFNFDTLAVGGTFGVDGSNDLLVVSAIDREAMTFTVSVTRDAKVLPTPVEAEAAAG